MQQGCEWHRNKAAGVMGMDLKTAFQRAPEYLRLLIVMRAIAIVVIALFYFGIKTWLNADHLPPPREKESDDHHGHGHH